MKNIINNPSLVIPIKSYSNAFINKNAILLENKDKPGIYHWINKLNGNSYVGSGMNLSKRIGEYYKESELKRNPRPIHAALLKHGYTNFTLEILEYCKLDELLKREQYYLDLLNLEYNILKHAYSLLGFKHSAENLAKFKLKTISEEHKNILSSVHLGKEVSQETRDKLSLATANYSKNNPLSPEALANITAKTTEREGKSVQLLNIQTNEILDFPTLTKAAEHLGITRQAVRNAINRESLVKELYRISE
uniref:GIY-YIG endonuclease n=1 Tax=Tolypocladium cylindrosporum TaxID=38005 RepID=A0A6G7NZY9_9HYPO|nr:GIY-YIG endonuclease [Tolypocladium cylindrosporum]QIJ60537.1 GIY-YIG endonuclease [Tolypocladium cylindrosporum]